jgi:hypothetical protein
MPYVAELAGREIFCLGCGAHFVAPKLDAGSDGNEGRLISLDNLTSVEPLKNSAEESGDSPNPER